MATQNGRHPRRSLVPLILLLVFLVLFVVSGTMVVGQVVRQRRENAAFEDLAQRIREPRATEEERSEAGEMSTESTEEPTPEATEFTVYDDLKAENPDLFGWVRIEGTRIDYPVMHTPDDPEFYLRRAFDGSKATSGVPFLDGACTLDCGNYIVYGHRMKNGTMFADLLKYADREFWASHPVIHFDTLNAPGTYEIIAAFYAQVVPADAEEGFRYYTYTDLSDKAKFEEYVRQVREVSLYETGLDAQYGDQLLTLSTCSYHVTDGRFVVVARKTTDAA